MLILVKAGKDKNSSPVCGLRAAADIERKLLSSYIASGD
jgi:hypothetical protein